MKSARLKLKEGRPRTEEDVESKEPLKSILAILTGAKSASTPILGVGGAFLQQVVRKHRTSFMVEEAYRSKKTRSNPYSLQLDSIEAGKVCYDVWNMKSPS